MEISLLKALVSNLFRFNQLSSNNIKYEPVQKYYRKIDEILNLLRPILNVVVDSQKYSNEQLIKALGELDGLVNEAEEFVESWHPVTSKFYFAIRAESLITQIQAACLDVLQILHSLQHDLPEDLSLTTIEQYMQKLRSIEYEQTSDVIKEAVRDQVENSTPGSESMVKIADSLRLTTNQELLMEAVALEKVKLQAEQDENDGEATYIDHMIGIVTHMHDLLVKIKQSQSTNAVPIPADFCCPLSLELMRDPVIVSSGQTYERTFIRKWLDLGLTVCPKTRQTLARTNLVPNYTVKALIANWCESNNVEIPDPLRSMNLNQTSDLLHRADSGTRGPTSTNSTRSTEPSKSVTSSHQNFISSSGPHLDRTTPSHASSVLDSTLSSGVGNGLGLDVGRISVGSFEEREAGAEDRSLGSSGQSSIPSRKDIPDAIEQFPSHSRNASVSSTVSNTDYIHGAQEDVNGVSHVSGDLTHYSSDVSGELTSETPVVASPTPHREPEYSPRLLETRSRSHTIWRRPIERHVPRIVSSSAIDTRADLLGVETQVRKLVEDLNSTSVDLQRTATAELRLLAKHNTDNRIVIANNGAISMLVGLLHSTDTMTQENAVTALLNLSINDNNKSAIANAEAINPLIHVLETGSPVSKENAAATLFSLSVIEENKARIGRSGAIKPLVELLGNGTPRGKKDASTALFNLSIFHENKVRIVQAGAVKYLVELMDPAAGMVDKAVAVLSNLATIPEGRSAIGQEGGIPVLVEVVELGSARGKENAAAALLQLCTNSNRFCSMVLQEGAVPPLVALSQSGTPRAKEKAQALLSFFRNQRHGNSGRG